MKKERLLKGDDAGCFAAALAAVRKWGGVLEHPEASAAWRAFGLLPPPRCGGWVSAGDFLGWTCCVEQGHYGHRGRKATWLYAAGVSSLPSLLWGPSMQVAHLSQMSKARRQVRRSILVEIMSRRERSATPPGFRDLLIAIARTAGGRK